MPKPVRGCYWESETEEDFNSISTLLSTGTSNTGVKYKGHVEIPNLSDENDVSEIEVSTNTGDVALSSDRRTKLYHILQESLLHFFWKRRGFPPSFMAPSIFCRIRSNMCISNFYHLYGYLVWFILKNNNSLLSERKQQHMLSIEQVCRLL